MSKIMVGDKVKFVKRVNHMTTEVPIGSVGIVTDTDERDPNGLSIGVSYRYKHKHLDFEWFMEGELEVVNG